MSTPLRNTNWCGTLTECLFECVSSEHKTPFSGLPSNVVRAKSRFRNQSEKYLIIIPSFESARDYYFFQISQPINREKIGRMVVIYNYFPD